MLGDVVELKRGYDLPKRARANGPFPIVSSSGISGTHAEAKVQGPGVVTGRYGTLGRVFYVAGDFWPLNTSLYVRDFKGNNKRFVALLLESMDLAKHDGASAVPGLNRNQLHTVPVRIPDRQGQDVIATIGESIDDLIENNRRRVEALEEMARTIYREWFVHFRYPGHEDVPLVDSPLGPIPRDWSVGTPGSFAEVALGGDWGKDDPADDSWVEVACLRGADLPRLRSGDASSVRRRWVKQSSLLKRELADQDVVVEGSGECGRALAVNARHSALVAAPIIYSNFCKRLRCDTRAHALFVARLFNAMVEDGRMDTFKTGTTIPNLNFKALVEQHPIAVPPLAVLATYEDYVRPLEEFALTGVIAQLTAIRDLLLPKLVTGQIDVSDLDLDALSGVAVA